MRSRYLWFAGLAVVVLLSVLMVIGRSPRRVFAGQQDASPSAAAAAVHSLNVADIDKSCQPCQDFYKYADGGWLAKNPVPPAYPSWGRFNELQERNREVLHQILERAANDRKAPEGSEELKIGDFYASCMDEAKVEADGIKPLDPELDRIEHIQTVAELEAEVARLQTLGVDALFRFRSTQDAKQSDQVIGWASQGGLGLPDRDYYTKTDEQSKQLRRGGRQRVAHGASRTAQAVG